MEKMRIIYKHFMFALEREPYIGQMSKADKKLWPTNTNWCGFNSHWYVNSNDSVKGRFYFFLPFPTNCLLWLISKFMSYRQKWRERLPNIMCSRCPPPFSLFWFIIVFFFYPNFCADLICNEIRTFWHEHCKFMLSLLHRLTIFVFKFR